MKRKTHNEIAVICRDALLKKKINVGSLPVVPWDHIVYTFAEGMAGTNLDKRRISAMFLACVRLDQRIQAILTPIERVLVGQK
jgi:hypothetical protein